ncbi:uncharacterized protein LOC122386900 isoform X4 [Amphibalanus amphitrite]|uniref:uncharacterized protein LOC122386900 isoform X4 n=1 Tax=Amphibalanus amphitrite TaxID=1232801 RepID=UPI001C917EF3|nr:uncharacterized protein LOC122386900 isoform X4 [Amphibalanus amphitrite]XP_043232555.1 uncharacterized protein LOC122386900 isoform X4 [Amphibalanus amphitrite]XP_043232556.1 uncharacterized protein LOC122386900 isoform X4 [Amphibalanus amphitrite]XP_043232557.1 uncharacterized protein LOC122386900 isoform X4 [Amphibalanus amphitrite]XP_043232558.1 uncharacterized protein LOC122386900 isoform X4 [Amphibalanus amphitrite]XP_043232559.1 uncharacterized protein LOC122386900 isoform X4 [Amphib
MERLLAGVPGAFIYLDDILLCGHDEDELLQRLERVLRLFQEAGLKEVIDKWLFLYRVTPHATTGETPGQLLLGYKPITRLDKLKPDIEGRDCTGAGGDCTGAGGDCTGAGGGCGSADGGPRSDAGAASAAAESCCCRRRRRVLAISANEPPVCRTVCGRGVRVFRCRVGWRCCTGRLCRAALTGGRCGTAIDW